MDPLELRALLERARDDRETAEFHRDKANEKAAELLALARGTEGITMTEAAEALGVSRKSAYQMLGR